MTLPAPAASTGCPDLPAISMPFLLSSQLETTLPSAGHIQETVSSSPFAAASGFSPSFCIPAIVASEYGRLSPRGSVLLLPATGAGADSARVSTPDDVETAPTCAPPLRAAGMSGC